MLTVIHASSITIGNAIADEHQDTEKLMPIISLNFPATLAQALTMQLFQPLAKPEQFIVAIEPGKKTTEVTIFCIIPSPALVLLPMIPELVLPPVESPGEEPVFLIGTQADIKKDVVSYFTECVRATSRFLVSCGIEPDQDAITKTCLNGWNIQLSHLIPSSTVVATVYQRLGLPVPGQN